MDEDTDADDGDPWVQANVRVRRSMKDAVKERAESVDCTRDEWIRRALEWALRQPIGTKVRT